MPSFGAVGLLHIYVGVNSMLPASSCRKVQKDWLTFLIKRIDISVQKDWLTFHISY